VVGFALFAIIVLTMTKPDFLKCNCPHCGGHIEFPAEAKGQTLPCPHCGQPTELSGTAMPEAGKTSPSLMVFAVIAIVVGGVAIGAGLILLKKPVPAPAPENVVVPVTNQPAALAPDEIMTTNSFAVSAIKLEKTPGSSLVYVTGLVRNLSDKQRYGVKVELGLASWIPNPLQPISMA
jgi:hypothetical protein